MFKLLNKYETLFFHLNMNAIPNFESLKMKSWTIWISNGQCERQLPFSPEGTTTLHGSDYENVFSIYYSEERDPNHIHRLRSHHRVWITKTFMMLWLTSYLSFHSSEIQWFSTKLLDGVRFAPPHASVRTSLCDMALMQIKYIHQLYVRICCKMWIYFTFVWHFWKTREQKKKYSVRFPERGMLCTVLTL